MSRSLRLVLFIILLTVSPDALFATALPAGIEIHDPDSVLRDRTVVGADGLLYFEDAEGTLRRFVTTTSDSVVQNPGSGAFHPVPLEGVREALAAVDFRFLQDLRFQIYLLPYPVASPLNSWASRGVIYLSPGVHPIQERQLHQLVAHEVGHIVHQTFLPDKDREVWLSYHDLRGIQDTTLYHATAEHRNRPHEIFAEDFRALYGGAIARADGSIENHDLRPPDQVPGLAPFFLGLVGTETTERPETFVRIFPNPLGSGQMLRLLFPGADRVPSLIVYDVSGRSVRTLRDLAPMGGGLFEVHWDGKDDRGRSLPRGVYYCQVRDGSSARRLSIRLIP